jgi:hypothetical protein
MARTSIVGLSVPGRGNAQAGSGAEATPGHGQARRAVAHLELFFGRFAEELNVPDTPRAACGLDIRRQTPGFEGARTRAESCGGFTMEPHPLLFAGTP